jgi:hypothetical protein
MALDSKLFVSLGINAIAMVIVAVFLSIKIWGINNTKPGQSSQNKHFNYFDSKVVWPVEEFIE